VLGSCVPTYDNSTAEARKKFSASSRQPALSTSPQSKLSFPSLPIRRQNFIAISEGVLGTMTIKTEASVRGATRPFTNSNVALSEKQRKHEREMAYETATVELTDDFCAASALGCHVRLETFRYVLCFT
jgi:hypothetical protein